MAKDKNGRLSEEPHEARDITFARWRAASRANVERERAIMQLHEDCIGVTFALWLSVWQSVGARATPNHQELRRIKLISDEKTLSHLLELADLPHLHHTTARTDRIDAIARFIDEAATLPDQQPPGSRMRRDPGVPLTFSTPEQLKKDLGKAHTTADTLIDVIKRTAPTLQEQFPLRDACQLIDLLEKFSSEAVRVSATYAERQQIDQRAKANLRAKRDFETPAEGTPVSPGAAAGKNSGRNWLLQKVWQLAVVHLGTSTDDEEFAKKIRGETRALTREVTRVLMGCEETINERTAADHMPPVALTPAEVPTTPDDWRKEIGQ